MAVIDNQRILAVIPARGGSKGVPGKNIRPAGGKPLIAWTIEAARKSTLLDRVILSSDDSAIIAAAKQYGCDVPFIRDAELATDTATTIDAILDAVQRCQGFDWVVVLQPTSPLRTSSDIDQAIRNCVSAGAPACVSVCEAQESPYWMYVNRDGERLQPLLPDCSATRRQDLPRVYSLNGAVYVANIEWLKRERKFLSAETVSYEMPLGRSLDIDTEADFVQLQTLLGDS
ncbi:cytidylyltransferase domain-containing protein [Achromobacter xylosoxidans]|uniref:acylneuraminate cytidylyltransferase family protein n=1 Tax=Alcaligenes xylosoxydans xylosoxydans TaxID=85698 RepID=UPI001EEDCC25|nr:acylneuraminate cytidylyltransferase family protein [Achromobacter xylosoxidans]MEC6408906.1 acylneuraminate cytidylyltransferase family protein [Achromobacter xylosoxidans]